jgi:hypothetical protein
LSRRKLRRRGRSSLLLFLNGNALDNGPHPPFAITFNLPECMML